MEVSEQAEQRMIISAPTTIYRGFGFRPRGYLQSLHKHHDNKTGEGYQQYRVMDQDGSFISCPHRLGLYRQRDIPKRMGFRWSAYHTLHFA